jgi:hypothetical protein
LVQIQEGGEMIVYRGQGRSKFFNKPTIVGKYRFASKKEAERYKQLVALEKTKTIRDLKVHPIYKLEVEGVLICRYIADFEYYDYERDGIIVEDVKGRRDGLPYSMFLLKAKLMYALLGIKVQEI